MAVQAGGGACGEGGQTAGDATLGVRLHELKAQHVAPDAQNLGRVELSQAHLCTPLKNTNNVINS